MLNNMLHSTVHSTCVTLLTLKVGSDFVDDAINSERRGIFLFYGAIVVSRDDTATATVTACPSAC